VYIWNWEPDPSTVGAGTSPNWTPQGNTGALQAVDTGYTDATGCLCTGTRILTDRGEVAVEALRAGDRVASAFGGTASVTWIGHRRVDCRRHPRPHDVWPVRVRQGAFADRQPCRDLFLSPDHAVFVGGVLIPVRYLINGATIVQEPADAVTYWHVELPRHDILLAEGLPCESYLDTGNRAAFENGAGPTMLHADFARRVWQEEACAELVMDGPELQAVRSLLLARTEILGHAVTADPALRLRVDSQMLRPAGARPTYRFQLPDTARRIHLLSRSAAPAHLRDDSDDHRPLGVAVSAIVLDGAAIPLTDPRLGAGWHAVEHDPDGAGWRWTNGEAELKLPGGGRLEIAVVMTERYWVATPRAEATVHFVRGRCGTAA
jgi:hypothetical protein